MKQEEIEQLAEAISINRSAIDNERILGAAEAALESSQRPAKSGIPVLLPGRFRLLVCAGGLAATFLIICSLAVCIVLSGKVSKLRNELELARQDVPLARPDDATTINLYLKEHQDVIAQHASASPATPQPLGINVDQQDILYYEMFNDQPEYMHPGIIVRGPSSQRQINSSEAPAISNGHTLTLSEAQEAVNFNLVSPSWLQPCYRLDQIRRIEDRDALQLLYTDGINSLSLFEQPLDGQRKLEPRDFREYAVYRDKEQTGGTILTWRDDSLSYVLIGNTELSQLMDIAQSINTIE
ncbi:MAG: hypothetical protein ACYS3S_17465 [Planctomycetota bacterium]|jgi:hypothetical protein